MTDKETMQMALDALNMYQTTLKAVVKVTGEQYTGDPSILIQALEKALARPDRKPLTTLFKLELYNLEADTVLEMESYLQGIEDAEAAHGIKETE